jgi:putative transposase
MTKSEAKPAIAAVNELFSKSPDGLREIVRAVMQEMLEAEMTDALGAEKGERTAARLGYRSGYYSRTLVTRVGKRLRACVRECMNMGSILRLSQWTHCTTPSSAR